MRLAAVAFSALAAIAPSPARATPSAAEAERIEQLIRWVESQQGVVFVRNGEPHPPAEAAAHLRTKLRAAWTRIDTAETFVDRVASRSSITGRPYRVRLADGTELDAGPWLRAALR